MSNLINILMVIMIIFLAMSESLVVMCLLTILIMACLVFKWSEPRSCDKNSLSDQAE